MTAIYDTLMRFNAETGKYEPRIAESLTSNADATEWTVKIRPSVKFSDGTDYDAAAVIFAWNRHRSGQPGAPPCAELIACPRNAQASNVYMALIKDLQAVDKLTVKATLSEPWASFAYVLADHTSMVPSPTALKKCDGSKPPAQCEFNLKPVGAGPFVLESFKPKDSITMVRNANYWNAPVHLDGIKFVNIGDSGGPRTYDAFKTGTLQGTLLRAPETVAQAHTDKVAGFATMQHGGSVALLNIGATVNCSGGKPEPACSGRPDGPTATSPETKSLKVRQAIAAAIDPKVINERASDGLGLASSDFLQNDFRWAPDVPGPRYDPTTARRLVAEAKAEGWAGKVRLLYSTSPVPTNTGLAIQAMLQTVGIDAQIDGGKETAAVVQQVAVSKDFDVAGWSLAVTSDDGAVWSLAANLSSTSASNRVGFKNAVVDQALKELRIATTDGEKKAAFKKIAEQVNAELPFLPLSKVEEFIVHAPQLQGLVPTMKTVVYFDKAWLQR
jgi:peptide/nickel transport system substrate-binding protein